MFKSTFVLLQMPGVLPQIWRLKHDNLWTHQTIRHDLIKTQNFTAFHRVSPSHILPLHFWDRIGEANATRHADHESAQESPWHHPSLPRGRALRLRAQRNWGDCWDSKYSEVLWSNWILPVVYLLLILYTYTTGRFQILYLYYLYYYLILYFIH